MYLETSRRSNESCQHLGFHLIWHPSALQPPEQQDSSFVLLEAVVVGVGFQLDRLQNHPEERRQALGSSRWA